MNPVTSLWYGVDPLAEKNAKISGFIYTLDNPIRLIDPDGSWSWPWESSNTPGTKRLIGYRGNGVFGIRIQNFSWITRKRFQQANNNPSNWPTGEVGINTEIAKFSLKKVYI